MNLYMIIDLYVAKGVMPEEILDRNINLCRNDHYLISESLYNLTRDNIKRYWMSKAGADVRYMNLIRKLLECSRATKKKNWATKSFTDKAESEKW